MLKYYLENIEGHVKLGVLWLDQLYDHQNDSCENTKYKSCCQPWLPEHKILQYMCLNPVRMEVVGITKASTEIDQLQKPLVLGSPTFSPC